MVRSEGITDRWLTAHEAIPTGRALIVVDDRGENSIVVVAGANAATVWPGSNPPRGRVVIAQLEVPITTVSIAFEHASASGATTILNPAPAEQLPDELLDNCSVVVPNEHEAELAGGIQSLLLSGAETVIVTRGSAGATLDRINESTVTVAPVPVDPIDTTGAGDAFCGNLAARMSTGASTVDAARWAAAAGALATTVAGAVPSLPLHHDVEALLTT